ncbi:MULTISPECIES: hypothetical protein [unclassified Variovorax]|uniref:hypothetical protein n=1 Tax=unclassified Variovorax TaxID=663243 RepID=UPI00076CDE97|nr:MULTISPECIES: hypothetical protein [unclassified Variovorax]KWT95561.1 hypothetical protein APY03_2438 [Variovorax sp. WDL1]PNG50171.1 hypothetical protein CHC06_05794 [Variovorax sp. B2]PNG51044.1 hypothetical protein CHC07_05700 [Variovorax sp. B4]VTU42193.1 hypothetical protein SRS16P1_00211 [Variovorax sp. SRS16]VTU42225.1 hypothetical protein E5P1_00209 [Variovorax sp. PBL-E5]
MPASQTAADNQGALSPRAKALGLDVAGTYFDYDTKMREPRIPSTDEAWEDGTLGRDARYARVVSPQDAYGLG